MNASLKPGITTHRIGEVTIQRIEEQCGPGFLPEFLYPDWEPAFLDEHRSWMVPACFSEAEGKFIASVHSWLLRTPQHTILIDTCAGNHKPRPLLPRFNQLDTPYLDRLRAAGVAPEQVDYVLCTHLHADHCGWNTQLRDGRWVPTFPNARYVFSRAEQERWTGRPEDDGFNIGVYQDSVLPVVEAGLADIVDGAAMLGEHLAIAPTPGHSPGHCAIRLHSGGREAVFSGDIMHQPVQIYRPHWNSRFCEDPAAARASRRWLLEHCAEQDALLLPAHFAGSHAGRVTRHGEDFRWHFA